MRFFSFWTGFWRRHAMWIHHLLLWENTAAIFHYLVTFCIHLLQPWRCHFSAPTTRRSKANLISADFLFCQSCHIGEFYRDVSGGPCWFSHVYSGLWLLLSLPEQSRPPLHWQKVVNVCLNLGDACGLDYEQRQRGTCSRARGCVWLQDQISHNSCVTQIVILYAHNMVRQTFGR